MLKKDNSPNAGGQINLLHQRELRDKVLSLLVGFLPTDGNRVHPWRRIEGVRRRQRPFLELERVSK